MKLNHAQQKIQRILKDNLYQRSVLSTSWSVEFLRLSHYKTSRMLFSKKLWESGKHYNFTLLLDMSGSMDWDQAVWAIKSCQNIIRLLKWIVNIKVSVFNNLHFENVDQDEIMSLKTNRSITKYYEDRYMDVGVAFDLDENGKKHVRKQKKWDIRLTNASYWNCETINADYEYKKLMQMDWRNVLIMIQDWHLDTDSRFFKYPEYQLFWKSIKKRADDDFAKNLYKKISRDIELVSIWIWTKEPAKFFDNFTYVKNANEIYWAVVKIFERLIV